MWYAIISAPIEQPDDFALFATVFEKKKAVLTIANALAYDLLENRLEFVYSVVPLSVWDEMMEGENDGD